MKLRIVILIIAIILGVVAVVAVLGYINSIRDTVEEEVEKVEILVAAQNIPKDSTVESLVANESVVLEAVPRKYLANGVLTSLENYKGYVVAAPINEGEQITTTNFIKPEDIGLSFMVPEDMVAISIPVDDVIGVSNLINVGDHVNVIGTFQPTEEEELKDVLDEYFGTEEVSAEILEEFEQELGITETITKTLLWNVEVLHIGERMVYKKAVEEEGGLLETTETETNLEEINTITLALSPQDSEKLVFTEEMGLVWLALLPVDGIEEEETPGSTFKNIL
ncbi:MAG: Flp pilus assembly protein CpaB, partial [Actinomycetia bacterium]|nr:Flp pilus assembly protein CpaB [Actinomycetes bacterium]